MEEIEKSFDGNLCRCTGYRPILDAFKCFAKDAPKQMKEKLVDIEVRLCLYEIIYYSYETYISDLRIPIWNDVKRRVKYAERLAVKVMEMVAAVPFLQTLL